MYLVRWDGDDVHVHLAGACAGCPGSSMTADSILLPAVRSLAPKARIVVTTGFRVPDGASASSAGRAASSSLRRQTSGFAEQRRVRAFSYVVREGDGHSSGLLWRKPAAEACWPGADSSADLRWPLLGPASVGRRPWRRWGR